jgi:P pilus assembly chaperone PapD
MRQTIIVIASTALVTAMIAIWGTSVIIANTQGDRSVGVTSDSADVTQLMRMIEDANHRADEKADPVD